ncbi:MAG: S-ribosylhomocysteine lyase [Clostridiales bacterium]|nr:S-ribosylhomocysteine lyase [Clostridiales bacterium]
MEKIESFKVDHTKLMPGMYVSRTDGDVTTYDIRTRRPNCEPVMDNASIHTIEHLFATYVRNSKLSSKIIYFGPMGCRTGFYFLVRNMSREDALELTCEAFRFIRDYEGEIPGASAEECGNYREHSLEGAKREADRFLPVAEHWSAKKMEY